MTKRAIPLKYSPTKLRIAHPEASLIELGNMLKSPIGKSGVNHRLKAIEKMAEELLTKEKKD